MPKSSLEDKVARREEQQLKASRAAGTATAKLRSALMEHDYTQVEGEARIEVLNALQNAKGETIPLHRTSTNAAFCLYMDIMRYKAKLKKRVRIILRMAGVGYDDETEFFHIENLKIRHKKGSLKIELIPVDNSLWQASYPVIQRELEVQRQVLSFENDEGIIPPGTSPFGE
jgi:hypothetical protein